MLKRRREKKTNYRKRLKLLLSRLPRLVVRRKLNNIIAQIIEYEANGDKTVVEKTSKHLRTFGWLGHGGNLPSAYLVGYLVGKEALKKGIKKVVLDIGLQRSVKGCSLYACAKGAIDAGLEVPVGEEVIPSEERIKGEHIARYARLLKDSDEEKYKRQFSQYIKNNLPPEELPKHFDETLQKIRCAYENETG